MNIKLDLPEGFLEEEIRDGYCVSEEMKRVWAVELDLLSEFDRVCREYELPYYASGGTILGAIRHGGYIPWDDDIDIMMHRKDYDRLCEIGPEAFRHPYFFQTQKTDRYYFRGHAQIRNSETTGILKFELADKLDYNQGIFIDIFPLDNVPDNDAEKTEFVETAFDKLIRADRISLYAYRYRQKASGLKSILKSGVAFVMGKWFAHQKSNCIFDEYLSYTDQYNSKATDKSGLLCLHHDRFIFFNEDIARPVMKPFEMLTIPIPNGYERIMDIQYGDWRTPVKEPPVHGGVFFDTEKPYCEYTK